MASVVAICNRALALIGEEPVTSLTDDTEPARRCNLLYADTRDAVLRAHPWNAAIMRIDLAPLAELPPFGFSLQYQLPSDCLRVLGMADRRATFRIEGRRLLTDISPASIVYVRRLTDPNAFDALIIDAMAARLAHDLAYALAGSTSLAGQMWELYVRKLAEARKADAQEGSAENLQADAWTDARAG